MLRESLLLIDCYFPLPLSTCDTGTLTLQNLSMPLTSESRMDYLLAWKSNDTVETASMLGLPGCRVIVVKFDGSSETLSLKFVWCLCWSRIWRSCETSSFEFVNCFSKWSMYFFWCTSWNYKKAKLDWLNSTKYGTSGSKGTETLTSIRLWPFLMNCFGSIKLRSTIFNYCLSSKSKVCLFFFPHIMQLFSKSSRLSESWKHSLQ